MRKKSARATAKRLVLSYYKTTAGKRFTNTSPTRWQYMEKAPYLPILRRWERKIGDLMSPRRLEVMYLLAQGMDTAEIAGKLFIQPKTVRWHLTGIYKTLGIKRQSQLIAYIYSNLPAKLEKTNDLLE